MVNLRLVMSISTETWLKVRIACELIKSIMRGLSHRLLDIGCNNGSG
jgi:hypothetical protein